jgi:signal transduction histidine kinase
MMELLAACRRSGEAIDAILQQAEPLPLRTSRLADLLRSFWPSSPLYACLLKGRNQAEVGVVDESGRTRSEWAEQLRHALMERAVALIPAPTVPGSRTKRKPGDLVKLPETLQLPGYALAVEAIVFRAHRWGVLALAVSKNAPADRLTAVQLLLAICSEQLAARLDAEAQQQERQALEKELAGQSGLASTGELAGPLAHEFNNFLNIVLLHVALLEADIPEKLRADLTELHRQGTSMTSLVKQFQQYRRRQQPPPQSVDVNGVVQETARALAIAPTDANQGLVIKLPLPNKIESSGLGQPDQAPLDLVLAPRLPAVLGSSADLRRLCSFLLTNAAAAAAPVGGKVMIQTEFQDNKVLLRIEDAGPSHSPESLSQIFEPGAAGRTGTNRLELAACETLVRRLQGKIRCANRPGGGLILIVELPPAPQPASGNHESSR